MIFKPFIIDSSGLLLIEKTPIYLSPNFNTNIVVKEIIDESVDSDEVKQESAIINKPELTENQEESDPEVKES